MVNDVVQLLDNALKKHVLHPLLVAACKRIAAAPSGTRNDTLNREVFALATSRVDLWQATAKKWVMQAGLHAGLTDTEIDATFQSAADAGTAQTAKTKSSLSFTLFRDIELQPRKTWLVRDWLGAGDISCLFGQPGTGKSTIAIDLAFHIAAGRAWFGQRVLQCGVLYVAAERADVGKRRMAALRKHYDIHDIPLAVVSGSADLRSNEDHAKEIIGYAEQLANLGGYPVGLMIIETVNRVLAGGDENSSVDMGKLIHMLALIQAKTEAHLMVVHHSPIEGRRMRGHSSLLGAVDTTIEVGRSGANRFRARIDKSNDGPTVDPISWTVESIELHQDLETGVVTNAPVVIPESSPSSASALPMKKAEVEMAKILVEAGPAGLTQRLLYAKMREAGIGDKRPPDLTEAKTSLVQRGVIFEDNGIWYAKFDDEQRRKYFGAQ
jgi:hypothetical protein